MSKKLYYLASPYSHKRKYIREERYQKALMACDILSERYGIVVISPIVYGHQFAVSFGYPGDANFWKVFDHVLMHKSDVMLVLQLEGWRESVGVTDEIGKFKEMGRKIGYINEQEINRLQSNLRYKGKIRTKP